ncbi:MAG: sulfatase-like hydrolase/transferase [Planctomycetota bacterium]
MHRQGGVVLLALVSTALLTPTPLVAQQRHNVLLVMIDDLGPEYVGCYAGLPNPPATPVLDQFAATGVRFENAIADPVCTPSRACLQTGRHAFRSDSVMVLYVGDPGLRDEELLLPEVLATSGYARAMIGKWHLGDRHGNATPNVQGWPHFIGTMYGGLVDYYNWPKNTNGVASTCTRYATTDQIDDALAWIQAQPATQPWLMLLCLNAPHGVFHAPPAHLHHQDLAGLSPATTPIPFYSAMVEAVDTELGRLLQAIAPLRATTDILVFGDNGTPGEVNQFGLPRNRCKGSLYRTGQRIPFLANGPSVAQPGRVVADPVHVLDVFPTVLELCAVDPQAALPPGYRLDGRSLLPLLQAQPVPPRTTFVEVIGTGYGNGVATEAAGYKLLRISDDIPNAAHEELYAIATDPWETNDLLARPLTASELASYQQLDAAMRAIDSRGYGLVVGAGCPGSFGPARLMMLLTPNVGATFYLRVPSPTAAPGPLPLLLTAGTTNLALDLGPYGMPGCRLYADPVLNVHVGLTSQLAPLYVPNDPGLIGLGVTFQGWVFDPAVNALRVITTPGYRVTLGS